MQNKPWQPESWRALPAAQQPVYESDTELSAILEKICSYPPLVYATEVDRLRERLALAAQGQAFVIQGGDCAERFDQCTPDMIRRKIGLLMQLSFTVAQAIDLPSICIGRVAGQFAKPRSYAYEDVDGVRLPIYRGDIVNAHGPNIDKRSAQPQRLLKAYNKSSMTLNFIRALFDGEFSHLDQNRAWGLQKQAYAEQVWSTYIDTMNNFSSAAKPTKAVMGNEFYTSHEGLLLPYEETMTRWSSDKQSYYNTSAHFLWIGNRTRALGGAHVEYFRGIANPIGVKLDAAITPHELVGLLQHLNPRNEAGKVMLIPRFGVQKVQESLPFLVEAVMKYQLPVLWSVDPMHGNTYATKSGRKTRGFAEIYEEVEQTSEVHRRLGSRLGGVHLEISGEDVTECVGGAQLITEEDLPRNYQTFCDPRLNPSQSLELCQKLALHLSNKVDLAKPNVIKFPVSQSVSVETPR